MQTKLLLALGLAAAADGLTLRSVRRARLCQTHIQTPRTPRSHRPPPAGAYPPGAQPRSDCEHVPAAVRGPQSEHAHPRLRPSRHIAAFGPGATPPCARARRRA